VAERSGEVGCWIIAHQPIGQINKAETFWHLDAYATEGAAEAAKASGSVVVKSLGRIWLLTIADKGGTPSGGERIAEIGPLPVIAGETYFRSVHGSDLYAGNGGAGAHAFGTGGLVHAGWGDLSRNAERQADRAGWRSAGDRTGRPADASDRNRHGAAPRYGPDPSRFVEACDHA
jgi:hypothetical protein